METALRSWGLRQAVESPNTGVARLCIGTSHSAVFDVDGRTGCDGCNRGTKIAEAVKTSRGESKVFFFGSLSFLFFLGDSLLKCYYKCYIPF